MSYAQPGANQVGGGGLQAEELLAAAAAVSQSATNAALAASLQQQQQGNGVAQQFFDQQGMQQQQYIPQQQQQQVVGAASLQPQQQANAVPAGPSMSHIPCTRCGHPNCDLKVIGCSCLLHVRCAPVPLRGCPNPQCFNSCHAASGGQASGMIQSTPLELLAMDFGEMDEARRAAELGAKAGWKKGRARKKAKMNDGQGGVVAAADDASVEGATIQTPELRTGRWTNEETAYCDKLISKFMTGRLPLPEGAKLNEFLSQMLKSKQSRLTKKMKNAKLSTKTFKRTTGFLADAMEARDFSESEDCFLQSISNPLERSELKFHIQKQWRETFSTYCVSHGQQLNVDAWLASVEEMDRRVHRAKDHERQARRKIMMGQAIRQDMLNPDSGVVITQRPASSGNLSSGNSVGSHRSQQTEGSGYHDGTGSGGGGSDVPGGSSSPFLHRIMAFMHRNNVPFEYVDAWVPSFVATEENGSGNPDASPGVDGQGSKCRLCFAGCMVARQVVTNPGPGGLAPRRAQPMSKDEQYMLAAFGDYSESFSFDVGCGLPGRVYHMGLPTWEQSVHNAPLHHFERVGGSQQWGIRTVVGIPVASPNVGRIVVVLYSRHDRPKDHDLVIRITDEFTRLLPSPKWKLVVDVGEGSNAGGGQGQMVAQGQQSVHSQQAQPQQIQSQYQPQQQTQNQQVHQQMQNQQAHQQMQNQQVQQQFVPAQQMQQAQAQQMQPVMQQQQQSSAPQAPSNQALASEVIAIFGEHMPSDPADPSFQYLQGFMRLRLLLLRSSRSRDEQDVVDTILGSYSSYKSGGRSRSDIALMLARDFMFLQGTAPQAQPVQPQQHQQQQQQQQQQQHQQFIQPFQSAPQNRAEFASQQVGLQVENSSMPPPSTQTTLSSASLQQQMNGSSQHEQQAAESSDPASHRGMGVSEADSLMRDVLAASPGPEGGMADIPPTPPSASLPMLQHVLEGADSVPLKLESVDEGGGAVKEESSES